MVEFMAGAGIPEDKMCQLIRHPGPEGTPAEPISRNTLRKHFKAELDSGHTKADTLVAQGLFKNATTSTPTYPGGVPVAQIFWLKTRARWRTADKLEQQPTEPAPTPEQIDEQETTRRLAFLLQRGAHEAAKQKKKT